MSLNVLIVDDSTIMRTMIAKVLGLAGLDLGEIYEAANGQEGLDALENHWIDLVLADINMPVMNGQEMIEQMRANSLWKDLPVIVVSTEGSQKRIESIRQQGAKFIHKPFTPEMIRTIIKEMIGINNEERVEQNPL